MFDNSNKTDAIELHRVKYTFIIYDKGNIERKVRKGTVTFKEFDIAKKFAGALFESIYKKYANINGNSTLPIDGWERFISGTQSIDIEPYSGKYQYEGDTLSIDVRVKSIYDTVKNTYTIEDIDKIVARL